MKKSVFLLFSILTFSCLHAQTAVEVQGTADAQTSADALPWPQNVQFRLDSLLQDEMFQTSTVGLMVYDLMADSALYCHNHRQLLRPASTMKLVTAITALDCLGGNYQFSTSLYYKGTVEDHTLDGELYCVGGMDPCFDADDLRAWVGSLRRLGVDTLRCRIVTDCSMKDTLHWGEGWCWDDDNPTLTPLMVSKKPQFLERFISQLGRDGITLADISTASGTLPADAVHLSTRSHRIDQILERMMKDSDNLFAESVFYQIAATNGHKPATAKQAREQMQRLIRRLGLNPKGYRLADGSGLSLYNYLSAELEVRLLRHAWRHHRIYERLVPSLPIAGEDGTLKKRMLKTSAQGNVRAKTGTVTGVSALAGYCTAPNQHILCFAIINQGIMNSNTGRSFQDRVCQVLCDP